MTDRTQQTFSALEDFERAMDAAVEVAFDDWWLRGRGQMSGAYRNARVKEIAALLTRHFLALAEDAPDEVMHCYGVEFVVAERGPGGARKLIEPWPLPHPYPELSALSARSPIGREK